MIGNDIVDLAEAKKISNWKRKGFLRKIFTEKEQSLILKSYYPEQILWLIWSVKESVYKAYAKCLKIKYFYPLQYEYLPGNYSGNTNFSFNQYCSGEIFFNNFLYIVTSVISKNFISTVAVIKSKELTTLKGNIKFSGKDYKIQQEELYWLVIKKISDIYNYPVDELKIIKDDYSIPYIYRNDLKINCSVSFSHHGKYGAYALALSSFKNMIKDKNHIII